MDVAQSVRDRTTWSDNRLSSFLSEATANLVRGQVFSGNEIKFFALYGPNPASKRDFTHPGAVMLIGSEF